MRFEVLTRPASDPLLLDEVKDHLRVDGGDDDASLGALIEAATACLEAHLGAALVARDVHIFLDHIPISTAPARLPVRPIAALDAVEVKLADGTWQAVAQEAVSFRPGLSPEVALLGAVTVNAGQREPLRLSARAGFGEHWNAVPLVIRQALLQLITYLYTHRGDMGEGANALVASGASALVSTYRQVRL